MIRYLATAKGLFDYLQGRADSKTLLALYLPGFLKSKGESMDELRMRVTAQGLTVSEAQQIIKCAENEATAHERRSPQKTVSSKKREAKLATKVPELVTPYLDEEDQQEFVEAEVSDFQL